MVVVVTTSFTTLSITGALTQYARLIRLTTTSTSAQQFSVAKQN